MDKLDAFTGRLSSEEIKIAEDFIAELDKIKGENKARQVFSGDVNSSRIRAKLTEIFVSRLLDTPLDLSIHQGNDGGIDTIYKGYYVQIKRCGTRTAKRGKPWFRMDPSDPFAEAPPWDIGLMVEDDAVDDKVFRLTGWLTARHWKETKELLAWPPKISWVAKMLAFPEDLLRLRERAPARSWPVS